MLPDRSDVSSSLRIAAVAALVFFFAACGDESSVDGPAGSDSDVAPTDAVGGDAEDGATPNADAGSDAAESDSSTSHDAATVDGSGGSGASAPTWHAEVSPLLDHHCGDCHVAGGIAPFRLDDYPTAQTYAAASMAAIDDGRMPPFPPNPDCHPLRLDRSMPAEDIDVFRRWIDGGMPEGDPADAPERPEGRAIDFDATHTLSLDSAYTPDAEKPDDYRCFILDVDIEEDMYVTGSRVIPGSSMVHHVLVYALPPFQVDAIEEADENEEGPGYVCFGSPQPSTLDTGDTLEERAQTFGDGGALPAQIGVWVPGALPIVLDEGQATRVTAGSRIVMQMHYNTLSGSGADSTSLELAMTDEEPEFLTRTLPIADLGLEVEAGDPNGEGTRTLYNYTRDPVTIRQVAGHMHLLGDSIRLDVIRADGSGDAAEECLLDIPQWDFDWQEFYSLGEGANVVLQPGDAIRMRCTFDNSAENQPFLNGEQLEPRDVEWGEGTYDEMCLAYVQTVEPFKASQAPDAPTCSDDIDTCVSECDGSTMDCAFACDAMDGRCFRCAIDPLVRCLGGSCGVEMLAMRGCIFDCAYQEVVLGGDLSYCFESLCGAEYANWQTCANPILDAGTCDARLDSCDWNIVQEGSGG